MNIKLNPSILLIYNLAVCSVGVIAGISLVVCLIALTTQSYGIYYSIDNVKEWIKYSGSALIASFFMFGIFNWSSK